MLVLNCHQLFFLSLKGEKKPQHRPLNVSERAHLYPQAQFQVPNFLLFPSCCFPPTSSPGPRKHAWSCTAFFQLHMALQCWIDLCAKVPLKRSFYLCLHLWLQSICFFLSHEVQVAALAIVMSSRHLHSANDVRSHSSLFTRISSASGDSWKYLNIGQIFKWYSM